MGVARAEGLTVVGLPAGGWGLGDSAALTLQSYQSHILLPIYLNIDFSGFKFELQVELTIKPFTRC